jgi:hypothetical protein
VIKSAKRVQILDEGTSQGFAGRLDFTGTGITASVSGNTATVTVSGGSGQTQAQVISLAYPAARGSFVQFNT